MSYVVTGVPPILVPLLWGTVKGYLSDACDEANGEMDLDKIYAEVLSGESILVIIYRNTIVFGAGIARKREFDSGKTVLFGSLLGGMNMDEWIDDLISVVKLIAKSTGCDEIYVVGRSGWERLFKKYGFQKHYTVLTAKLED